MKKIRIRFATREDCEDILRLRTDPTAHSKMFGHQNMVTIEDLQRDGFDAVCPYFKCILVEECDSTDSGEIQAIGYGLYHYSYAAFEGKSLHLEDICVVNNCRRKGVGSAIMKRLAKVCAEEQLARITLEVVDCNEDAINFFKKNGGYNSTKADDWIAYAFEGEALANLAK